MSEEQKKLIEETVENLKHLDKESLLIVKGSVEVLKARIPFTNLLHSIKCVGKYSYSDNNHAVINKVTRVVIAETIIGVKMLFTKNTFNSIARNSLNERAC